MSAFVRATTSAPTLAPGQPQRKSIRRPPPNPLATIRNRWATMAPAALLPAHETAHVGS